MGLLETCCCQFHRNTEIIYVGKSLISCFYSTRSKPRNLPHRLAETDCWAVCPRRVPGKQRGGHQRATYHRRPEGEQTAVLSEPVTHGKHPSSPGSISNWNPQCWCGSIGPGLQYCVNVHFYEISGVSCVMLQKKKAILERGVRIDFRL